MGNPRACSGLRSTSSAHACTTAANTSTASSSACRHAGHTASLLIGWQFYSIRVTCLTHRAVNAQHTESGNLLNTQNDKLNTQRAVICSTHRRTTSAQNTVGIAEAQQHIQS